MGSFKELEAVLLIAMSDPLTEADFDIKDHWHQEYLEALVWGGWIKE